MSHDILVMHAWCHTGHTSWWHIDNHSDHSSGGDLHNDGVMLPHPLAESGSSWTLYHQAFEARRI